MSNENRRLEAKDMPIFHKIKEVYRGKVWIYDKLFGNIGGCLPCCRIKFGAQIHQPSDYQGTALNSMSSAGSIKW